jgi:hypothetical protein
MFRRIRNMESKVKVIIFVSFVVSSLLIGGLAAKSVNSEYSDRGQAEHFIKMDEEYLIRAIRSAGREKFFERIRNADPQTLSRIISQMNSDKIARLVQAMIDDLSASRNPASGSGGFLAVPERNYSVRRADAVASPEIGAGKHASVLDGEFCVIIHPSNPVTELTQSELLSVFSGYTNNWSQLGGPDIPVEVIILSDLTFSNLPDEYTWCHVLRTPFSGVVMAGVAATRGAIGVVIARDRIQRSFLDTHQAIKRIVLKN